MHTYFCSYNWKTKIFVRREPVFLSFNSILGFSYPDIVILQIYCHDSLPCCRILQILNRETDSGIIFQNENRPVV